MSDGAMVLEMAERLIADLCTDAMMRSARRGEWARSCWDALAEMGLTLALVPEGSGGFGLDPVDAFALVRLAGRYALPLPLAETMVANHALAAAGLPVAEGTAAFIPAEAGLVLRDAHISGVADRVPWGGTVATLVVEVRNDLGRHIVRLDKGWSIEQAGNNIAQMPRDTLRFDTAADHVGEARGAALLAMGAGMRALQTAGGLERVLDLTVAFVSEREQFGRPLAHFQAVQHELAKLAGEAAAASAAADLAAEALADSAVDPFLRIAAARIRGAEAVGTAVGIAQQLHGALGFTEEHRLHWYTTALWSWRDEYGGAHHWTQLLGAAALRAGGEGFWPFVVAA